MGWGVGDLRLAGRKRRRPGQRAEGFNGDSWQMGCWGGGGGWREGCNHRNRYLDRRGP